VGKRVGRQPELLGYQRKGVGFNGILPLRQKSFARKVLIPRRTLTQRRKGRKALPRVQRDFFASFAPLREKFFFLAAAGP
jgi:hypothetical protein